MGKRGPAPLPTAVKAARGTRKRARELPGAEPTPKALKGTVSLALPPLLKDDVEAARTWKRLGPVLKRMRVLTEADLTALEALCLAYSRALQAERELRGGTLVLTTPWGTVQANPLIGIARNAWGDVRRFAQEFGLTPSARTRVRVEGAATGQAAGDPAADFLFGGKAAAGGARVAGHIGPR